MAFSVKGLSVITTITTDTQRTMKTITRFLFLTALALLAAQPASAQEEVLGKWYNAEKTSQIQVYQSGDKFYGSIAWLKEPNDDATGQPRLDKFNPSESLRDKPILGLVILRGFKADGDKFWSGGTIYDPRDGKTYSCNMTLTEPDKLDIRGYVGISLFGRTTSWSRVKE